MTELQWPPPEPVVLERLTGWAEANPAVRACVLTSSRAAPDAVLDEFSDYDVVVAVTPNAVAFTADDRWLHDAYDEPMVTFRSEHGNDPLRPVMRLVVYMDHTKVDFAVVPVSALAELPQGRAPSTAWDIGWRVLVDKDSLTDGLPSATGRAHIPAPPDEATYLALVEEFWWESTYVAKNLWRGDLVQAKYNLDKVMIIDVLRTMLEWRIEIDHQWNLRPGVLGRHFRERLDPITHDRLERCFADGDIQNNWVALMHTCSFFADVARQVATSLGFKYPDDLEERVTNHLRWVRALPPKTKTR
jgi:aminoglycoside 6-adenylyltransferase